MTSTIDTDQHPDVAEISALTEGVLPPERTSAVRGHLNGCDLCTEVRVSLEEIRDLLGTLPGPSRMPADVASRIDAAIAAESLLDASAPGTVSRETASLAPFSVSRETEGDRSPLRRPGGRRTRPHGSTGPGRQAGGRRRWRTAVLGVACVLGLGVGGAAFVQSMGSSQEGDAAAAGETSSDTKSEDTGLSAATLESKVRSLLDKGRESREGLKENPSTTEPDTLGAQSSPAQPLHGADVVLPPCIRNGIDPQAEPLAAGESTFEGKRVYVVVLPHRVDADRVDAYVVDSSCITTAEPRGDVLLNRVYARH